MDYVNTTQLSLDLAKLERESLDIAASVAKQFGEQVEGANGGYNNKYGTTPLTTRAFTKYNFFTFPRLETRRLFNEIQKFFRALQPNTSTQYYVQAWVNVFNQDENLDKHDHWPSEYHAWHGYFVVNGEPSVTTYWLPDGSIKRIGNKNNFLIISKSDGDSHATSKWKDADKPRITIAFDILPADKLSNYAPYACNHWIPI